MAFALDILENFEYPDLAALQKFWPLTSAGSVSTSQVRTGSRSYSATSVNSLKRALNGKYRSVLASVAEYYDLSTNSDRAVMAFGVGGVATSSAGQLVIAVTPSGTVKAIRGYISGTVPTGTVIGESASVLSPSFAWNAISAKFFIDDTSGYVQILVNGSPVLELVNVDTRNVVAADYVDYFQCANLSNYFLDDLYVGGDTAASLTTQELLGDVQIIEKLVNAAGTYGQLVSSSGGAPYTDVDESLLDTANYIYSSTANEKSTFNFEDIAGSPSIKAVQFSFVADKSTAGFREARGVVKSGATEQTYTARAMSTSAQGILIPTLVDPNTSAAWTPAGVNAVEFGPEVL